MLNKLITTLKHHDFDVYEYDKKPYNLNIVGVRSSEIKVNEFNDVLYVFWKYHGLWSMIQMKITTLAGLYYLENPMNPKGCAILVPDQYKSTYKIDVHNGKYTALCQRLNEVKVYRDDDQDTEIDLLEDSIQEGMFGINIHRSSSSKTLEEVGKYSAGCQVIQNPYEFDTLMHLVNLSSVQFGNSFTYTLINEEWI